jgi:hypothetical protein
MSLKKGGAPALLPCVLTLTGQGSSDKISLTYHNRKASEMNERLEQTSSTIAGLIPWLVAEWDLDFALTEEGVLALDDEYPGVVEAIMQGFHKARRKEAEKN